MTLQEYFKQFYNMSPYFEITEEQWAHIKKTYPKNEVKLEMAKCAMTYPLPYADISEKDAYEDYMKLKGIRWNEILTEGEWFPRKAQESRYPYTYKSPSENSHKQLSENSYKQVYFSRLNTGNKASNYFQQENRWSVDGVIAPGPKRTWESESFMTSLMGAAYTLKMPKVGKNELRTMIGLRKYICSQFKPNVAKIWYEMHKSKTVLDFSMGWGDRLAGFFAADCTEHYVGLDPRVENHPIYEQQREFYKKHSSFFENDKKTDFFDSPAEDFDYSPYENYFDMVFTSPPYFGVERYSYDDTQSWVRYKSIDEWNEQFLHKALGKIIPTLKKGGIMSINIADVYSSSGAKQKRLQSHGKQWLEICNPMNDFILSKGMTYMGCIGMEMAKRPNSGGAGTASDEESFTEESLKLAEETKNMRFAEPMWIWKK